jgi:hypothetical protein
MGHDNKGQVHEELLSINPHRGVFRKSATKHLENSSTFLPFVRNPFVETSDRKIVGRG